MKIGSDEHGHRTLDGARWHYPSKDNPRLCGEPGCDHQMGTLRRFPWQDEKKKAPSIEPKFRRKRRPSR